MNGKCPAGLWWDGLVKMDESRGLEEVDPDVKDEEAAGGKANFSFQFT